MAFSSIVRSSPDSPAHRSEVIVSLSQRDGLEACHHQNSRHSDCVKVDFLRSVKQCYRIGEVDEGLILASSGSGCRVASVRKSQAAAAAGALKLVKEWQLIHRGRQHLTTVRAGESNFEIDELQRVLNGAMNSIRLGAVSAGKACSDAYRGSTRGCHHLRWQTASTGQRRNYSAPSSPTSEANSETVILRPIGVYDLGSSALFSLHPMQRARRMTAAAVASAAAAGPASAPVRRRALSRNGPSHMWGRWTLELKK